jgi:hypothetical protein
VGLEWAHFLVSKQAALRAGTAAENRSGQRRGRKRDVETALPAAAVEGLAEVPAATLPETVETALASHDSPASGFGNVQEHETRMMEAASADEAAAMINENAASPGDEPAAEPIAAEIA